MNEQKPDAKATSADIKKQIEQAKDDLKNSGRPLVGQIANEINASESTPKEPAKVEVKPEPQKEAAKRVESPTTEEVDFKEWAKKKGIDWTTDETVISALRKSDQAFHEKRAKEKQAEQALPPYVAPPPPYQSPPYGYQPPAYQPPFNNRVLLENLARQYNMPPEDVERLMNFNKDYFEAATRGEREKTRAELETIKLENQKNSVFRELSSDPIFRKPEIAIEFHRVLEEMQSRDPQSFEQDPRAYIEAYKQAQLNVFRRNLEGQPLQEGVPPIPRPPLTPPKPLGQGSGGGAYENENAIDPVAFAKLSRNDKAAILEKMGLKQPV